MTIGADGLSEEHAHGPGETIAVRDNARAGRYEAVRGGEVVGIMIYECAPCSPRRGPPPSLCW